MIKLGLPAALAGVAVVAASLAGCGGGHHRHRPSGPPPPSQRVLYRDGPNGRYLLDSGWTARADPRDVGLRRGWQRPGRTAGFKPVRIPNAFNAGDLTQRGFHSRVEWYRVRFVVPPVPGTTGWRLRFEAVNNAAQVFFHGRRVGSNRLAFLPFEVRLPGARPGWNEAVVRVDGRRQATPLPPASRPAGWWNYGGIVREVYLRRVGAFDVSQLHVVAVPGSPARVHVTASANNTSARPVPLDASIAVTGPGGFTRRLTVSGGAVGPGRAAPLSTSFDIPRARLWAPGHPWLYELRLAVPGGQVTEQQFGVRRFSVRDGRLLLNGHPLELRGVSFHEMTAARGFAITQGDRALLVRELGMVAADAGREHYAPHPALLEAFDRLGIVFWEQIPVWRLAGPELRPTGLRPAALDTLRRTILRDRNHASLGVLSVSNETLRGGGPEVAYLAAAKHLVRALAPGTLVAADTTLTPLRRIPDAYRALDVLGLNSYVGWYNNSPLAQLGSDLDVVRARFPRQALVVAEVGAEANRAGSIAQRGTYGFQGRYLDRELGIIASKPYMSGVLVWVLRDFPIRPGWVGGNPRPSPPFNDKGLFHANGAPKPALAAVQRRFRSSFRSP